MFMNHILCLITNIMYGTGCQYTQVYVMKKIEKKVGYFNCKKKEEKQKQFFFPLSQAITQSRNLMNTQTLQSTA